MLWARVVKANCRSCGVLITNQNNVGEERKLYPGQGYDYLCMSCHLSKADRLVERTRRALGLEIEAPNPRP